MAALDYYEMIARLSDVRKTKIIADRHGTRSAVANFNKALKAYKEWEGPNCDWESDLIECVEDIDEWDNYK